jgi:hypothetical protein
MGEFEWDKGWGPKKNKLTDPPLLFMLLLIAVPIAIPTIVIFGGLALTAIYVALAALVGGN